MSKQETNTDNQIIKLLTSLQAEVQSLKSQVANIEQTVLRERLNTIEETLAKNHLYVYTTQRTEPMGKEIDEMLNPDCQKRPKCSQKCKDIIQANRDTLKEGSTRTMADIEQKILENEQMIEKTKGYPCENCFQNFGKVLKREKRAYKEIVLVEAAESKSKDDALDIPLLVKALLEPVSNDARLRILDRVYHGKRSFSELSNDLGIKAGHLAFHLRKLVTAKLIIQEGFKGDYIITERGLRFFNKMLELQSEEQNTVQVVSHA